MDKPLSISGYKRYMTCPKMYEYYDIKKDRPSQNSSPLIIGTIVDQVIMGKYENKDINFRNLITDYQNKVIKFKSDDLDLDLLDLDIISTEAKKLGWKGDDIGSALKDMVKSQEELSNNQYKILSLACWQCIDVKIDCMLKSFEKWIAPKLKRVFDVQQHLDDGKTHGYLDFMAETTDGKIVLFDLKTSKMAYDVDSVLNSPQLSLYAAMKDVEYAGYIVLIKTLNKNKQKKCNSCDYETVGGNRKKCPECGATLQVKMNPTSYAQFIVSKVPKTNKELTTKAMYDTIYNIDVGAFPRNLNTCNWVYGEKCPYYNKCWKIERE